MSALQNLYSNRIFPFFLDQLMRSERFDELRKETLRTARGNVLEIGFGTGANLPFYPPEVSYLTAVEPNPGMRRYLVRAKKRLKGAVVPVVEIRQGRAEALPFPEESFDTVVSTLTLCSVGDPSVALAEIRRVLKSGGRFLFLEHGRSPESSVAQWQERLNSVNRTLAEGCQLVRDTRALVAASGLEIQAIRAFYLAHAPRTHGYFSLGRALKNVG